MEPTQPQLGIPWTELFSIAASIVSLILAGFAIWLSIVFYRLSNESSGKIKESADRIAASVDRLEMLFDKLYADTFSMMKDTVSDMRKHIWRDEPNPKSEQDEEIEKLADEKVQKLQQQFEQEVTRLLGRQHSTDAKIEQLGDELKKLVNRAVVESRNVEVKAREETLRDAILNALQGRGATTYQRLATFVNSPEQDVVTELFKLAREGILTWEGAPSSLTSTELIHFTNRGKPSANPSKRSE